LGQSSRVARQESASDRMVVADRIVAFLRHLHPYKTAECVAADTGIRATTVAKWLERGSAPNLAAGFRLIRAYGPEFVCAVMTNPPEWLDAAAREEKRNRLRTAIAALQAELEGSAAS
jgi:DNA-binding phage protein